MLYKEKFIEILNILDGLGLLNHVILIGSKAVTAGYQSIGDQASNTNS